MRFLNICVFILLSALLLTSCTRDLSSDVYTSGSTLSLTMRGEIVSFREVTIKESDMPGQGSQAGLLAGGVGGAAIGGAVSNKRNMQTGVLAGAALGSAAGVASQHMLSKSKGYEYIIKVDTSQLKSDNYYYYDRAAQAAISSAITNGLITVVQGRDQKLPIGAKVYVIFSGNRARVIPMN